MRTSNYFAGALWMRDDGLRHGTQQKTFPSAVSMRAHYDQIRTPAFGLIEDYHAGRTGQKFALELDGPIQHRAKLVRRALNNACGLCSHCLIEFVEIIRWQRPTFW